MATTTEAANRFVEDYVKPAMAAVEEDVRDARQAVDAGYRAVEDCAAEARMKVRRYPLASLVVALSLGALAGCLMGFTAGRFRGRPTK